MVDGVIMGYIISRKTQSLIILICSGGDLSGLGQGVESWDGLNRRESWDEYKSMIPSGKHTKSY